MKKDWTLKMVLCTLIFLSGCCGENQEHVAAGPDRLAEIPEVMAIAMATTNTNWQPIDEAMTQVVQIGNPAIPFLELNVRLAWDNPLKDGLVSYRSGRSINLLARIGTPEAEKVLVKLLKYEDENEKQIIVALALINKVDAAYDLAIDRAWYDTKTDDKTGRQVYEVWWEKTGKAKYASGK